MKTFKSIPRSIRKRFFRPVFRFVTSKIFTTCSIVLITSGIALWTSSEAPEDRTELFALISNNKKILALLFDNAESIAITSAGLVFLLEFSDRQKRKRYEAWGVINSAQGQAGNGGRTRALEELNREGVDLEGVTVPDADLSRVNLCFGKLLRANFENAQLDQADFEGAFMQEARLSKASLWKADLQNAQLTEAKFIKSSLEEADLSDASLVLANLQEANLRGAILRNANLEKANLEKAKLWKTDLRMANLEEAVLQRVSLRDAKLQGANLHKANLDGARYWTDEQLEKAYICETILPEGCSIDPNRDCKETIV